MAASRGCIVIAPCFGIEGLELVVILIREVNIELVVAIEMSSFWPASLILLEGFFIFRQFGWWHIKSFAIVEFFG